MTITRFENCFYFWIFWLILSHDQSEHTWLGNIWEISQYSSPADQGYLLWSVYGPLAPGLTSHWKFADDFLKTCSVSHLSTHSFITSLRWGWFHSFIHELLAGSCTTKLVKGCSDNCLNLHVFWSKMRRKNTFYMSKWSFVFSGN